MLIIKGIAYTPEYSTDDTDQIVFTRGEMTPELAKRTIGVPVYIEHDTSVQVGTVVKAGITRDYRMMVLLSIEYFDDMIRRTLVTSKFTGGAPVFRDLSLGHKVLFQTDPKTGFRKVIKKNPFEVSIVKKGDRPKTHILEHW